MKRVIWLIPVFVMALAMAGCGGDDDSGGDIGDNLRFSDMLVYNADESLYTGADKTFTSNAGGSGLITGGKMSFSVDVPTSRLEPIATLFLDMEGDLDVFSHATYLPADTMAQRLIFTINLSKMYSSQTETSATRQIVHYIYVNKDCTINATAIPPVPRGDITINIPDLNLRLKRGWNPIHFNLVLKSPSGTLAIGKGNLSNCNWVFVY